MAGFSRAQHAFHFRPMVDAAWRAQCGQTVGGDSLLKDRTAKDKWYRTELHEATGADTTKDCNSKQDFEAVMAHFERIAGNGIKWQLKAEGGSARRLIFKIREFCQEHDLDESYVRGLARQALKLETLPLLERMEPEQLLAILKTLRADGKRIAASAHRNSSIDIPF